MTTANQTTSTSGSESSNTMKGLDPTNPEVYASIKGDTKLMLEYADVLDFYFSGRVVDVRNNLRGMGWDGEWMADLSKDGAIVAHKCVYVGAGRNCVGVEYCITGGDLGPITIADSLQQSSVDLANCINLATRQDDAGVNIEKANCSRSTHNPKPYVVVRNPGQDDEDIVDDFKTDSAARKFMRNNPGTDLMKRLADGTLTTDF